MSGADWVIIAIILVSIVQAAKAGFFHEAFGIGGLVLGYLLAAWHYDQVSEWLIPHLKWPWLSDIAGFLIIFLSVMILAGIAARIASWATKEAGLSVFDHMLGGPLGLLRGGLIVAVVLMGMTAFTPTSKWLEGSAFAPYFLVVGRAAIWLAPSELRARFYNGLDMLHQSQLGTSAARGGRSGK
jgi:membrane protein required for colicin V production